MSQDAVRRDYLSEHGVEKVLVAAVAQILKERPEDPVMALGKLLCKPKEGFVSYTNWPPNLKPFVSHAGPSFGMKKVRARGYDPDAASPAY